MINIYKTVNPSHLDKLQIIQNKNKLILIKKIMDSSTPFVMKKTNFQNVLRVLSGGLGHE